MPEIPLQTIKIGYYFSIISSCYGYAPNKDLKKVFKKQAWEEIISYLGMKKPFI
jgi:hypothetical protein